jgi:hypothetical protein
VGEVIVTPAAERHQGATETDERLRRLAMLAVAELLVLLLLVALAFYLNSQETSALHDLTSDNAAAGYISRLQVRCAFFVVMRSEQSILVQFGVSPIDAARIAPEPSVRGIDCQKLLSAPVPPAPSARGP